MSQPRVRYSNPKTPQPADNSVALDLIMLLIFAFLPVVVGMVALGFSISDIRGWYSEADLAPWTPELSFFIPAWLVIYALIGTATWMVWRTRASYKVGGALFIYALHLALNALWIIVFFTWYPKEGLGALWLAVIILGVLTVLSVITIAMYDRASPTAAWLFVPYLMWIGLTASMNIYMAVNN